MASNVPLENNTKQTPSILYDSNQIQNKPTIYRMSIIHPPNNKKIINTERYPKTFHNNLAEFYTNVNKHVLANKGNDSNSAILNSDEILQKSAPDLVSEGDSYSMKQNSNDDRNSFTIDEVHLLLTLLSDLQLLICKLDCTHPKPLSSNGNVEVTDEFIEEERQVKNVLQACFNSHPHKNAHFTSIQSLKGMLIKLQNDILSCKIFTKIGDRPNCSIHLGNKRDIHTFYNDVKLATNNVNVGYHESILEKTDTFSHNTQEMAFSKNEPQFSQINMHKKTNCNVKIEKALEVSEINIEKMANCYVKLENESVNVNIERDQLEACVDLMLNDMDELVKSEQYSDAENTFMERNIENDHDYVLNPENDQQNMHTKSVNDDYVSVNDYNIPHELDSVDDEHTMDMSNTDWGNIEEGEHMSDDYLEEKCTNEECTHEENSEQMRSHKKKKHKKKLVSNWRISEAIRSEKQNALLLKEDPDFECSDNISESEESEDLDDAPPFSCEICDQTYMFQSQLDRHKLHYHSNLPRNFHCLFCDQSFETQKLVSEHENRHRQHSADPQILCYTCGEVFNTMQRYYQHEALHSRKFVCSSCDSIFTTNSSLQEHNLTHMSDRVHTCQICGMSFHSQKRLKVHIRMVHKTSRNIMCEKCGKSFKEMHHLKRHKLEVHENLRQFICEYCTKAFANPTNLRVHVDGHKRREKNAQTKIVPHNKPSKNSNKTVSHSKTTNKKLTKLQENVGVGRVTGKGPPSNNKSDTLEKVEKLQPKNKAAFKMNECKNQSDEPRKVSKNPKPNVQKLPESENDGNVCSSSLVVRPVNDVSGSRVKVSARIACRKAMGKVRTFSTKS